MLEQPMPQASRPLRFMYLSAAPFCFSLGLNALSPIMTEVAASLGLERQAGLMVVGGLNNLLLFLPMALCSLLYSFGGRMFAPTLPGLGLALALLFGSLFFARDMLHFGLVYLAAGAALGLMIPTLYEAGKVLTDPVRSFQTSININVMIGVGLAAGQFLSAFIGGRSPDAWRQVYLVIAAVTALTAGLLWWVGSPGRPAARERKPLLAMLDSRTMHLLVQYLPGSIPWGALTVFAFPYLEQTCGHSKSAVVILVTVLGVGMVAGSLVAGRVGDALRARGPQTILLVILAFFVLDILYVLPLLNLSRSLSFPVLVPLYFVGGLLLAVPGSYIKGLLFEGAPPDSIQPLFSMETFLESIGKGLGPAVVAGLIHLTGDLKLALFIACAFWLLCIVPVGLLMVRRT